MTTGARVHLSYDLERDIIVVVSWQVDTEPNPMVTLPHHALGRIVPNSSRRPISWRTLCPIDRVTVVVIKEGVHASAAYPASDI